MKLKHTLIFLLVFTLQQFASAQVTDDELKKYIIVMDSIETLKNKLTVSMNNLSKGNAQISASRFSNLIPIIGNEAKLKEAKATPEEIAYVKKAEAKRNEETMKFQQAYQSLVRDYLGEATFTKVRNSLKTNAGLKKKYDSLMIKPIRP